MRDIDRFRGCLIGGAAGDALGYAVEFREASDIFADYGENGITTYELTNGVAEISDDTQMSLFTANALLYRAAMESMGDKKPDIELFHKFYLDWYATQAANYPLKSGSRTAWLMNDPRLFARRAPGNTCLSALSSGKIGTMQLPINRSKGCGGIMRVAPIGIFFSGSTEDIESSDLMAAEAAAVTHGHELGYTSSAMLAHIVRRLSENEEETVLSAVTDAMRTVPTLFADAEHMSDLLNLMQRAVDLTSSGLDDLDAIRLLGAGWVAEETLAIAVYCAVKYEHSFEKALIAAVNHDGDSDSTGAVTGNILGTRLGYNAIPHEFIEKLELRDVILELAGDMFRSRGISGNAALADDTWESKYLRADYVPPLA